MSTRILTLALFITRNLFRTLLGILPPVLTLGFYRITFTYQNQGDPAYLTAVGGIGLALVCVITTLLVADRANKAAMYSLLARLPRRIEFLAAVLVSVLMIMLAMATLYLALVLGLRHMSLTPIEFLLIMPRWFAVFTFAATLGLMMSKLASRYSSHVITFVVLGALALTREQYRRVNPGDVPWLAEISAAIMRPITETLTSPLDQNIRAILPTLSASLMYALAIFMLATWLFQHKDILWAE
jgi:hypothetical protein